MMEGAPAGAIAEESFVVLELEVVAVDLDRRQHLGAMRADDCCSGSVGHRESLQSEAITRASQEIFPRPFCAKSLISAAFLDRRVLGRHNAPGVRDRLWPDP